MQTKYVGEAAVLDQRGPAYNGPGSENSMPLKKMNRIMKWREMSNRKENAYGVGYAENTRNALMGKMRAVVACLEPASRAVVPGRAFQCIAHLRAGPAVPRPGCIGI